MLIILQYPVYDLRRFEQATDALITKPQWSYLSDNDVNGAFVRTIGAISFREAGNNDSGENYYSTAKKAIRFLSLPVIEFTDGHGQVVRKNIRPIFRRFFFDGMASAKYEIGFSIDRTLPKSISKKQFEQFVKSLLSCLVEIPVYRAAKYQGTLASAGKALGAQFERATTGNKYLDGLKTHVPVGNPALYVERRPEETVAFIGQGTLLRSELQYKIGFHRFEFNGRVIGTYDAHILKDDYSTRKTLRELRIAILKLNAYRGTFLSVLKYISNNDILPPRGTLGARNLDLFLTSSFSDYLKVDKASKLLAGSENYLSAALAFEDVIQGKARDNLRENLRNIIQVRGNYFNSIFRYLEKQDVISTLNASENKIINLDMSEININQTDNSNNSGVINTGTNSGTMQVLHQDHSIFNNMDYAQLALELAELRKELKARSDGSVEQDIAISEVGKAEQAAKAKDPSKILGFLKAAGKWTLDIAKELTTSVAEKVIEHAIGLG